ncbi:MAG: hypothetical protein AAB372_03205 [Patescibacteria group bacterium]
MKNVFAILFLIFFGAVLYGLTLRGVYGNFASSEVKNNLDQTTKPLELSPERGRYLLTVSLAENKSFALSKELADAAYPDVGYYEGRFYVYFAPGISLLALPFYLIGKSYQVAQVGAFSVISLFAILNLVFLFLIGRKILNLSVALALLAALIFGFAASSWSYAITLYQHHVTTFFILSSFYAVWRYKDAGRWSWFWGVYVWFCFGYGIAIDYPNALLIFPVIIYFFIVSVKYRLNDEGLKINARPTFFLTSVIFIMLIALHGYYNHQEFGSWKRLSGSLVGYKSIIEENIIQDDGGKEKLKELATRKSNIVRFFAEEKLARGFNVLMFSRDRGLFLYAPIFLLGILGLFMSAGRVNLELGILYSLIGINVFLYSSWGDPWGGWAFGPRYLIPTMAVLSLFIADFLSHASWKWTGRMTAFLFIIYSSAVSLMGALTTNAVPPKIEADPLGARYGIARAFEYFQKQESSSFLFNHYFVHQGISLEQYYYMILALVAMVFAVVLFILPLFEEKKL